jgi:Zn-dependent peptidase ImmA (M78 family)/transcriptional regulator with XRE-family HTH domain
VNDRTPRVAADLFDPVRLRIARQALMLRKKDLAERVGVSAGAISQYENGTASPSPKVAAALALALGMPGSFFIADRPLGPAPSTTAHFRSLRSTTKQERDRAFAHALLTWELSQVLERYVRLPALELPADLGVRAEDPASEVESAASRAREALGVGSGPVPHVVRLLEAKGVICTRLPAQTRRVFAFSCDFPQRPVVVLASERTHRAAGRFDAAHELAHLILHHDEEPGSHAVERQAHAFASQFLAPSEEIADLLPHRADWKQLLHLKQVWGISIQALLYRARALKVMPEHTYRRAVTELNARGWRANEPGDDGRAEEPVVLRRALELLAEEGRTVEDVAAECRLSVNTIMSIAPQDDRPQLDLTSAATNTGRR